MPALVFTVSLAALAIAQIEYPWWVTARFDAVDQSIESIAIHEIDSSWSAASPLRPDALPADAAKLGERLEDHESVFALDGDFDGDGRRDRAVVGVYRTKAGDSGRFLLVLSADRRGKWSKRALFKHPGEPRFSVLFQESGRLVWAFCMECDAACDVVPTRRRWRLNCEVD